MKYLYVVLALGMGGCGFAQGFRDRGLEMAGEMSADALGAVVEKKLGDDFKELSEAVKSIPGSLPKPLEPDPSKQTIWYGLGSLAAYIVGSLGKGYVRKNQGGRSNA